MYHPVQPNRPSFFTEKMKSFHAGLREHDNRISALEVVVNAAEAAMASKEEGSDGYRFYAPRAELISLPEIAQDVTRSQPYAHVVIEGKDYNKFNYLLLHAAIYNKMEFISKHTMSGLPRFDAGFDNMNSVLLKKLKTVTPVVKSLNIATAGMTFREIMETLTWIEVMPVRTASEPVVRVVVRKA